MRFYFFTWLGCWLVFGLGGFWGDFGYMRFALNASPERLRAYHAAYDLASTDFYAILKACDAILPASETLQIILPETPKRRYEFLREKARYILYPRNYGENMRRQAHILVYGVPDYQTPEGYVVLKDFGPDKYLLTRQPEG